MSENTGRLHSTLHPELQSILYAKPDPCPPWKAELAWITEVDLAHVLMLAEQGIISEDTAGRLLAAVCGLRHTDFAALARRPTPRGLYLAYEGWLIERLGVENGGALHTGRSRNDLNATVQALAIRMPFGTLARELLSLGTALLDQAEEHQDTVMPAYTHYQAAVPITLGHYLAGVAAALSREAAWLLDSADSIRRCPLGAGAVGGTTVPIRSERTAELLGFTEPVLNSVDAVASQDCALRLTAAAALLGVVLDRVAQDLLLWTTAEFAFIDLPEDLVGSSSMMPQKRNPFILEHVQGKSAAALGALVGAAGAMRGRPFTNSIAVRTEASTLARASLGPAIDAVRILRFAVAGLRANPAAMTARAESGLTAATALAEDLVASGMPFRQAHFAVGAAARAVAEGTYNDLGTAVADRLKDVATVEYVRTPAAVVAAADYGGGPGPTSSRKALRRLRLQWKQHQERLDSMVQYWSRTRNRLEREVRDLLEKTGHALEGNQ